MLKDILSRRLISDLEKKHALHATARAWLKPVETSCVELLVAAVHDDGHQVCYTVVVREPELLKLGDEAGVWEHDARELGFIGGVHARAYHD